MMLSTAQFGRAIMAHRGNGILCARMMRNVGPSSSSSFTKAWACSNTWNGNGNTIVMYDILMNGSQTQHHHHQQSRYFTKQPHPTLQNTNANNKEDDKQRSNGDDNNNDTSNDSSSSIILYEGPFAKLSLRLKRVSISSAVVSLVGIPLLVFLQNNAVPASGQMAVGGTALFAATGSTMALSYCFSPYVHTLEQVNHQDEDSSSSSSYLIKATTRNIIGLKVETIFDPATDISPPTGNRPFCNFEAKGRPMYIHPELLYNEQLRTQLVGDDVKSDNLEQQKAFESKKKQDDDFL